MRVNNRRMHIQVTGESTPTVLFESGMGASCLSWKLVQPAVAEFSRAVSYDRAGHGWSDPAREPVRHGILHMSCVPYWTLQACRDRTFWLPILSAATSAERSHTCIETKWLAWCWWTRFTLPNGKVRHRTSCEWCKWDCDTPALLPGLRDSV